MSEMKIDIEASEASQLKTGAMSPKFAQGGRCCWGGMAKWLFVLVCVLVSFAVFAAIMVPVTLYVIIPAYTQSSVNKSTMSGSNLQITGWGTTPGKVEAEMYDNWLPIFAQQCNDTKLLDKEYFLQTTVKDNVGCLIIGSGHKDLAAIIDYLLSSMLPHIANPTWSDLFASFEVGSCSQFNPDYINATLDVTIGGIPSIMSGSLSESYLDLYIPQDSKPWGRIAIPKMNLNNKVDGNRVMKNIPVQIGVSDRHRWLQANIGLMHLEPFTSGYVSWEQKGSLYVDLDLGLTYNYKVDYDKVTPLGKANFTAGPFSKANPNIGNLDIIDPKRTGSITHSVFKTNANYENADMLIARARDGL